MLIPLLLEGLDPGVVRREELEIHLWEKMSWCRHVEREMVSSMSKHGLSVRSFSLDDPRIRVLLGCLAVSREYPVSKQGLSSGHQEMWLQDSLIT